MVRSTADNDSDSLRRVSHGENVENVVDVIDERIEFKEKVFSFGWTRLGSGISYSRGSCM